MQKFLFKNNVLWIVVLLSLFAACKSKKAAQASTATDAVTDTTSVALPPKGNLPVRPGNARAMAPAIIYKTRKDYSKNVAVQLAEDKKAIASYPAPSDLMINGQLKYPTPLNDGFWLDERGITTRTAFLSITCEEYTRQGALPPSEAEMMKQIVDSDPVVEMYNCGPRSRYSDLVNDLNRMIADKKFEGCERIK